VLRRDFLSLDQGHNVGYGCIELQGAGHARLGRRCGAAADPKKYQPWREMVNHVTSIGFDADL
jgi:hypothetical protein